MKLDSSWKRFTFPDHPGIVYIIGIDRGGEFTPIYVGESTTRHIGRLGDYVSGKFTAQTDFKVSSAAKYLLSRGENVLFAYRQSLDPKGEEKKLTKEFEQKGYRLLTPKKVRGYKYEEAGEETERQRIEHFVDTIIAELG